MPAKRILLIESGHFIGGVIRHLFTQQESLTVTEASPGDVEELLSAVDQHRPDVVVMDDSMQEQFLSPLLDSNLGCEKMMVCVVYTNSNRVTIFRKQQINVRQKADLFAAL